MSEKAVKKRLDVLVYENGYVQSREKAKAVIMAGLVYGVLQALQGGVAFLGFGQFMLDYLLAFTVLGLAGLAKKLPEQWGLYCAIIIAALARIICHTLAGILFWDTAPWASFVYNISYLGPDTLICVVLAFAIARPVLRIMKAQ